MDNQIRPRDSNDASKQRLRRHRDVEELHVSEVMASRCLGANLASPVTTAEFYRLFKQISQRWAPNRGPRRIALAVSGGGDSMALAYLCGQLASWNLIPNLEMKALVIDHRSRQKSTEEARKVAGWMKDLGLESEILRLQWPDQADPASLKSFETDARRLRYRTFGEACLSYGAGHLFLGHHNDDNVETALLRLSAQHPKEGLVGFDTVSPIPECEGLYGVSGSGSLMNFRSIYQPGLSPEAQLLPRPNPKSPLGHQDNLQPFMAAGGVQLCRPFRTVSKARLLATCHEAGIPYVTDPTNADPTVTPRNAVRQLLASDDLPQALRTDSLSSLITRCRAAKTDEFKLSNLVIQSCKIVSCDLRTSSLVVQLPTPSELDKIKLESKTGSPLIAGENLRVQYLAIQRFSSLVTRGAKQGGRSPYSLTFVASNVFSRPYASTESSHYNKPPHQRMSAAGALWTAVEFPIKMERRDIPSKFPRSSSSPRGNPNQVKPNLWLISPLPQRSDTAPPVTEFNLNIPGFSLEEQDITSPWTDWQLWDERYWVRVRARAKRPIEPKEGTEETSSVKNQNSPPTNEARFLPPTTVPIIMRLLREHDTASIARDMELSGGRLRFPQPPRNKRDGRIWALPRFLWDNDQVSIRGIFRNIAKDKIRETLPVLSSVPPNPPPDPIPDDQIPTAGTESLFRKGKVYALPSIFVKTPMSLRVEHPASEATPSSEQNNDSTGSNSHLVSYWELEWDLVYRKVDPEIFRLAGYKASKPSTELQHFPEWNPAMYL